MFLLLCMYLPSTAAILQRHGSQHLQHGQIWSPMHAASDDSVEVISANETERSGDYIVCPPVFCPCATTPPPPPAAVISTLPTSLTLICEVPEPYEFISWWLYRCLDTKNQKLVQITSAGDVFDGGFDVRTGKNAKGAYSSLFIKDITSENSAGLYQCFAYSPTSLYFSQTDYFIIGRKTSKKNCEFISSRNNISQQIKRRLNKKLLQPRVDTENYENFGRFSRLMQKTEVGGSQVNTLVFDFSDAISSPIINNDLNSEFRPPQAQNFTEIPIQNSSYIRFDYTNGEKVQNRINITNFPKRDKTET